MPIMQVDPVVPGAAAAIAGATSPSRIRLHLRAGLAQLCDQGVVAVALENDDRDLASARTPFASAARVDVLRRGRVDVDRRPRSRQPHAILSM